MCKCSNEEKLSVSRGLLEHTDKSLQSALILPFKLILISSPSSLLSRTKRDDNVFILLLINSDKREGQTVRANVHCRSLHLPVKNVLV